MNASNNREQAIRVLEACKAELRTKLEQRQHDLEAVEHSIRVLRGIASEALPGETGPEGSAYADLRPQQAVAKFFQEHPQQPYKPSVAARKLRRFGYQPTTTDRNVFVTQVRTACLRLAEKGILKKATIDGRAAFQLAGG